MTSFFYIILAILGLSFLIFIHELGHYFMARRVGMRVETFSIGFGKPLYSWEWQGTKWQIGWLLFGGYVKIAGMDGTDGKDPYEVKDGFFGKGPWDRIKVAFMGPLVNIVFAILVFAMIWALGGRDKRFAEFTPRLGWVDTQSELYQKGIRPGDEIAEYNNDQFHSFKDHIYALLGEEKVDVKGYKVSHESNKKTPFELTVKTYPHPGTIDQSISTVGVLQSARYIIYDKLPGGRENPLPEGSPMRDSGIEYGDRLVWVDGQLVFSEIQLSRLINDNSALLTIERDNQVFLRRVPRVQVKELRPETEFKEELIDWQYEADLSGKKIPDLYAIPYNLTHDSVVEARLRFIDNEAEEEAFPKFPFSQRETPLVSGDKILAVDGTPIEFSYELFKELQKRKVNIIVLRDDTILTKESVAAANKDFNTHINWKELETIIQSIGTETPVESLGSLHLLKPVTPVFLNDLILSPEKQAWLATEFQKQRKEIEGIEDPERRAHALRRLGDTEKQKIIGLPNLQDRKVVYNPTPIQMFSNVFGEIWRTLKALFTGALNPKWVSGPIGIVHVVQSQWMLGVKEALFWIGAISLNLGIINLLPLPVLDGGTIVMSFVELITGKRLNSKTYEKVVIFFAFILIGFFIFLTYNDVTRIFGSVFR